MPGSARARLNHAAHEVAAWQERRDRTGGKAVLGESAGGNLAAMAALLARDRQAPLPNYQALIFPITNFAFTTPSYLQNANAPYLTRAAMVLATVPDHAD